MRVMIAEDHPRLAEAIATVLRRDGIAVDVAFDGSEALHLAALAGYDVIVLDRDLPRVHGDDVCRRLVADAYPGAVLMLTASGTLRTSPAGTPAAVMRCSQLVAVSMASAASISCFNSAR